jgi:PAS domain S-box-containing protein
MPATALRAVLARSMDWPYLFQVAALAACYYLAADASLLLAIQPGYATAVWPPSGIALAVLLAFGLRLWPGIWVGAILANLSIDGSPLLAPVIATGNTLEAVCACWLARRLIEPPVNAGFVRPESVFRFVVVVAVSGIIAATPAVGTLYLSGHVPREELAINWYTWWQGDAVAMVVLTPFLLAWLRPAARTDPSRWVELGMFVVLLAATFLLVFEFAERAWPDSARALTFLLFPFMVWAGCRFDERAVTTSAVALAAAAIWITLHHEGPFLLASRNQSLLVLQAFAGTSALLGLVLCAFNRARADGVADLRNAQKRLEAAVQQRTAELETKNRQLARDFVEQERLAATLQRRETQLAEAQAITHIGSWTWDVHSDHVTWSDELYRIYGLTPDEFSASFEGYISRVHPEDRARVTQAVQAALELQQPWELNERIVRPDGTIRVLRSLGKITTDADGRTIAMHGVCLDDTERVRLERIQRVHLDVTSSLVQATAWRDAIVTALDIICQRLDWSIGQMWRVDAEAGVLRQVATGGGRTDPDLAAFARDSETFTFAPGSGLPGHTWQERRPVWIEDVVLEPNFPRARVAERAGLHAGFALPLIAGAEVLGVIEFFHQEVRRPDAEALQMLTVLGSQLGEYIVRNESAALLRQSEERFRLLVEGVADYAIFMLDERGLISTWNAGAERIKGYRAEDIIGQHFSRFYTAADIAAGLPVHALRAAAADGRFVAEGWRIRKDGSAFWAHVTITALRDSERRLLGFAKVTRDMTERRRMEALEEASRQTRQFLAMLGHELRNPLAPISNAVSIMHAHPITDPLLARCRDLIDRQVNHLSRLVDDLLDASRIASGKIELRREPIDVSQALRRAVESSRPLIEARGQRLDVTLPPEPVPVNGDLIRLSQVVQNLLNNAAKFTPDGGRIELSLVREGNVAVIRVRDSGIGIAPELLPKVFDLFAQGDRGLDRSEGGLGIGLTLVREIAQMHGGSVHASSDGEGRGAEFQVRLPVLAGAGTDMTDARPGAPGTQGGAAQRILIIDDNHDAADSMATLLRLWGHQTWSAHDGYAALALASEHAPQIVLLDIGLPGMDGYEVAHKLRELDGTQRSVLVAVTGYGQAEDRLRSREAGFDHHLVKPVDIDALRRLLG